MVVTTTSAQSCLWGLSDFFLTFWMCRSLASSYMHTLYADNKKKIDILGAILIQLSGTTGDRDLQNAAVMAHFSSNTWQFYIYHKRL